MIKVETRTTSRTGMLLDGVSVAWLEGIAMHRGYGFDSQGTHIVIKCIQSIHFKSLWIKASKKKNRCRMLVKK